jgi:hypothetical protein
VVVARLPRVRPVTVWVRKPGSRSRDVLVNQAAEPIASSDTPA